VKPKRELPVAAYTLGLLAVALVVVSAQAVLDHTDLRASAIALAVFALCIPVLIYQLNKKP